MPWKAITDIGLPCGHGSVPLTPATGAIAASCGLNLHPRDAVIKAPLDKPVA